MVTVILDDKTIRVSGRVAAMVRWLAERAERLNTRSPLKVEFNCGGSEVKPRVMEEGTPIRI